MSSPVVKTTLPFWLLMLIIWFVVALSMGRSQSMGLYLSPVTAALGTGREAFGLAMAMSQLMMGVFAPISGAMIDRYGAGRVAAVCLLTTASGLWMMYAATSALWLLASGTLMGIGVSGTGFTAFVGTVGRLAPPEKRMKAIASMGMAAGIGNFIALPLMDVLIHAVGWQTSLLWLVALVLLLIPLSWPVGGAATVQTGPVRDQTWREALTEAVAHPGFFLLSLGFFVCGFHVAFIVVHLPAFTTDLGMPTWVGPWAISAIGITNLLGTYLAGASGRYIEKRRGLSLIYFGRAVIFLGFLYLPMTPVIVIGLCALLGLFWLATIPLTSGLVATFFGTTWMSMLFGIVFFAHQVGAFLGVWLGGRVFDVTKSYATMWWISIGLGVLAGLINWPIQERPVARLRATVSAVAVGSKS